MQENQSLENFDELESSKDSNRTPIQEKSLKEKLVDKKHYKIKRNSKMIFLGLFLFLIIFICGGLYIYLGNNNSLSALKIDKEKLLSEVLHFKLIETKNMKLSEDKLEVTKINGGDKWEGARTIGDQALNKKRINRWKVKITKSSEKARIRIGIIKIGPNIDITTVNFRFACYIDTEGCHYYNYGAGRKYRDMNLKEGDEVEVVVDLWNGTISFIVNGKDLGLASKDLSTNDDFYPYFELFYQDKDSIRIIDY